MPELGAYEQQAIRTVERLGMAVVERPPSTEGCWVVWQHDESYRQYDTHVFATELDALRWAHKEDPSYRVTFVPWGMSPCEVDAEKKGSDHA